MQALQSNLLEKILSSFDTEIVDKNPIKINHTDFKVYVLIDKETGERDKLFLFRPYNNSVGQSNSKLVDAENGTMMLLWNSVPTKLTYTDQPNTVGNYLYHIAIKELDTKQRKFILTEFGSKNFVNKNKDAKNPQWSVGIGNTTLEYGFSKNASCDFEIEFNDHVPYLSHTRSNDTWVCKHS